MTTDGSYSPGSPAATPTPASSRPNAGPSMRSPHSAETRSDQIPREPNLEPVRPDRPQTEADRAAAVGDLLRGAGGRPDDGSQGDTDVSLGDDAGEERAPWEDEDAPRGPERGEDGRWRSPEHEEAGEAEGPSRGRSEPLTLKSLAERLEMPPERLYDLEVTTGDGEAVSLGELKDAWADREASERETAEKFEAMDERETALSQDSQRLGMMIQRLREQFGPERLGHVLQEQAQQFERVRSNERELLMQTMPELADPARLDEFRSDLQGTLGRYGIKPHEISSFLDHRMFWFARDAMKAMRKLEELRKLPKPEPSKAPNARSPQGRNGAQNGRAAALRRARSGSEADKVRGISALLSGDG